MVLGASYYPEFYQQDRWQKDVDSMAEIGFKVVRMAEFAWCRLEPSEGQYDFSWLDKIIGLFAQKGIKTILGTPTGAPPYWILNKYSDLAISDIQRNPNNIVGGFGNYCKNHPGYREYSKKIVSALAEHYKDNENVIMFQIDNEFMGTPCYCDNCKNAFIAWAKDKYQTIENYNKETMTMFQGRELSSFDDIILPIKASITANPAYLMNYKKFISDSYYDYCKIQVDEIKKIMPNVMVTTNFCTLFMDFDHFKMVELFDIAGCDTYPKADGDKSLRNSMKLDLNRALKKKNFWVLEQQCSPVAFREYNYTLEPLEARLFTYKSMAQGADGIVYFRWNAIHTGGERFGAGIIRHEDQKGRTYYEVKQICDEINSMNDFLDGSEKSKSKVAIVYSNLSSWVLSEGRKISKDISYIDEIRTVYDSLYRANIDIDFVTSGDDISSYELVIAPAFACAREEDAKWLEEYTANGGQCLFSFMSGMFNENNYISSNYYQGVLRDLLGIKVTEWAVPYQGENFGFEYEDKEYPAQIMNMVLELESAQSLGTYTKGFYKNTPALTVNKFGKGKAYYLGTSLDKEFTKKFVSSLIDLSDAGFTKILGDSIDIKAREKDGKTLFIVMNHESYEQTITLNKEFKNALTGEIAEKTQILKPFDTMLLMD